MLSVVAWLAFVPSDVLRFVPRPFWEDVELPVLSVVPSERVFPCVSESDVPALFEPPLFVPSECADERDSLLLSLRDVWLWFSPALFPFDRPSVLLSEWLDPHVSLALFVRPSVWETETLSPRLRLRLLFFASV